jgi:hypothetical protein
VALKLRRHKLALVNNSPGKIKQMENRIRIIHMLRLKILNDSEQGRDILLALRSSDQPWHLKFYFLSESTIPLASKSVSNQSRFDMH